MVPLAVGVATFAVYVLSGNTLDVSTALTSLALFEILRFPLFMLPNVVNNLVEAAISIKRIEDFLNLDEKEEVPGLKAGEKGVVMNNATLVWEGKRILPKTSSFSPNSPEEPEELEPELTKPEWETALLRAQLNDSQLHVQELLHQPTSDAALASRSLSERLLTLRRCSLSAAPGELVAVVGSVGSGKSTLLSGILGECRCLGGTVSVSGKVAYVSQKSFIMNDTLRNNVTFSERFDQSKYDETIEACALEADLRVLPAGDSTEIGEKGINLSGGQKVSSPRFQNNLRTTSEQPPPPGEGLTPGVVAGAFVRPRSSALLASEIAVKCRPGLSFGGSP